MVCVVWVWNQSVGVVDEDTVVLEVLQIVVVGDIGTPFGAVDSLLPRLQMGRECQAECGVCVPCPEPCWEIESLVRVWNRRLGLGDHQTVFPKTVLVTVIGATIPGLP